MVVALAALFVALGGGAYAGVALTTNSVLTQHIKAGNVNTSDLAANAVTGPKLRDGAVKSADVANGSIVGADISDGSITDTDIAGVAAAKVSGKVASAAAADTASTATSATNADRLDNLDSTELKPRWLLVSSSGAILAQSGGFTITASMGSYTWIDAGSNVNGKLMLASLRFAPSGGEIAAVPCGLGNGGGPDSVACFAGANTVNHLYVETQDSAGTDTPQGFYVAIFP
jgi:hypothetical protein